MLCRLVNVVTNVQKIKQYTIQILIKVVKKGATGSEMPGASAIGTIAISKKKYQILQTIWTYIVYAYYDNAALILCFRLWWLDGQVLYTKKSVFLS